MNRRTRSRLGRTLALTAVAAAALVAAAPAATAADSTASSYDDLRAQLETTCVPGSTVTLGADLDDGSDQVIETDCSVTLDLDGHDLRLRTLRVGADTTLTLTDLSVTGDPGLLSTKGLADEAGIRTSDAALVVTGRVVVDAEGSTYGAGIGGGLEEPGGETTINDRASVTAQGGERGAGIGSGDNGFGDYGAGTTDISGDAVVFATGGERGAGIGGGYFGVGGTTTITGGIVVATGGHEAAGIGGGSAGDAGLTLVSGDADVTAQGGPDGAGIGSGKLGDGGPTTITDEATVAAYGARGGAGIGTGRSGYPAVETTVSDDATVLAVGGSDGGAGIGGGRDVPGGDTAVEDDANVTAYGGSGAAGVGGGDGAGGEGGNVVVDGADGGTSRLAVQAGSGASAVGAGAASTSFGSLSVDDGAVNIEDGDLRVDPGSGTGPEVTVGEGGLIESRAPVPGAPPGQKFPARGGLQSGASGAAGRVVNHGAITLFTEEVDPDLEITDHDYLVTFDPNGRSARLADEDESPVEVFAETFEAGERSFPEVTRRGYLFRGWNTEPDGSGERFTPATVLEGASDGSGPVRSTVYAQWRRGLDNPPPTPPSPPASPDVRIDGTPKVGTALVAETEPAASGVTYTYQWLRDGEPIAGATDRRYRPTRADVARRVTVVVTAANARGGTRTDTSRAVVVRPAVGVVGTPRVGQELTPRVFVPRGARATCRWETSARPMRGQRVWREVGTGSTYTLKPGDARRTVRLVITLTGEGYSRVVSYSSGRFVRR